MSIGRPCQSKVRRKVGGAAAVPLSVGELGPRLYDVTYHAFEVRIDDGVQTLRTTLLFPGFRRYVP